MDPEDIGAIIGFLLVAAFWGFVGLAVVHFILKLW